MQCRRDRNWPGRCQFNRIAWGEGPLRGAGTTDAVDSVAAVLLVVGTDSVKHNLSGLRAPQGIRFDRPNPLRSLLVRVVKFDAQAVGGRKPDDFNGGRTRQTRNGDRASRRPDNDIAS